MSSPSTMISPRLIPTRSSIVRTPDAPAVRSRMPFRLLSVLLKVLSDPELIRQSAAFSLADQFQYLLVARMGLKSVQIGIMLDPRFGLVIRVRQKAFQQIEGRFDLAQRRVATG